MKAKRNGREASISRTEFEQAILAAIAIAGPNIARRMVKNRLKRAKAK
jgi:hypothetical protein